MELYLPHMLRKLFYTFCILLVLSGCRKENSKPQWDIAVVGPLLHASLTVDQLIADSLLATDGTGAQFISIDEILSTFDLDTLAEVPDTSITTISIFPA